MKRTDITPGQVVSKVTFRDSRQGWPFLVLSTDSYEQDRRRFDVVAAPGARLTQGSYSRNAVGLLAVRLAFSMVEGGRPVDVLDFRAKVDRLRELASVQHAIDAIEAAATGREHAQDILDDDGTPLGRYELLTGLQMVAGDYIELTLAERRSAALSASLALKAEAARNARVVRSRRILARLAGLGITGYSVSDWSDPSRPEALSFEHMERLLALAESAVRANRNAGIGG